jgi:hypothetical protein
MDETQIVNASQANGKKGFVRAAEIALFFLGVAAESSLFVALRYRHIGSATPMRGKSLTCRNVLAHFWVYDPVLRSETAGGRAGSTASLRLAAHRCGRAIA